MAERNGFPENLAGGPQRNGTNGLYYPSTSEAEGEEISLHEVLEVLFKNKWIILACFILVLAGVAVYTVRQAPQYEAKSTVYVNSPQANAQLGDLFGLESYNRNIANEIEIVKSRKIAMRVADQLVDIERVPGSDQILPVLGSATPASTTFKLEVAQRLQQRIRVQPVTRGVDIIELIATSTIPGEAALISTLYAEEYVAYNREISRSRMSASREFLDDVTDKYSSELQTTEEDLRAFLNKERVVAPDEEARRLIEQVSDLQGEQNQARLERGMVQAAIRELEAQIEQIKPGLAGQLSSGDSEILAQLTKEITALEVKVETKYARNPGLRADPSKDPALVEDLRTLATLRERRDERSRQVANLAGVQGASSGGLGTLGRLQQQVMEKRVEASTLDERLALLQEQLRRAEARLSDIPRKDIILRGLQRSRQTTEELYISLLEKLQEARIAEQSELGYVDVVDKAIVPHWPVRPRVQLNLMFGAVLGLLLGIGLAFVRNAVDNKVRKPEDLRKRGHQVVGVIPDMERLIRQDFKGQSRVVVDGHEYGTRLLALLNPLSPVAEGYRRVRTNIQFSRPDAETRTLMVTSPSPSEGKTVTALNLAVTMAQAGRRTLYVDADLRRPQGHHMMGLRREPGLVDLLFDAAPDNVEQFATDIDNYLYVIPAGRDVPNPAEVLGSRKMQSFLKRWRQEFEVILVDTPPTLIVADALILAAQCDGVLVVCGAGETNWQAMDRCKEALEGVGADLIGVLLNRFDAKAAYGGYKYGYGYGYEYGYSNYYYGYGQRTAGKAGRRLARKA